MFKSEEILALKLFCQEICTRPRPLDIQPCKREGIFLWCQDWELIEICKYLFNGKDAYYGDPPPNRLKFNPLWSKDDIATKAEGLIKDLVNADKIIEYLRSVRNGNPSA